MNSRAAGPRCMSIRWSNGFFADVAGVLAKSPGSAPFKRDFGKVSTFPTVN